MLHHRWICLVVLILMCACAPTPAASPVPGTQAPAPLVFVGTYTADGQGKERTAGIFVYRMDPKTGALTQVSMAAGLPNPSYLTIDPSRRYLLAVSETGEYDGQPGGALSSYAIDPASGALTLINSQPTRGASPCYVSVDPSGKWALVANYSDGSVTVLPLGEDGRLGAPTAVIQHTGSGPNPDRQEAPHAHSILTAPGSGTLVLAADLGIDRVMLYDLDSSKGTLSAHVTPFLSMKPGSGPRHMVFHPNQNFLYVVSELDSSITAFQFDGKAGAFQELQTISALPADFKGQNSGADIHITPSGKFLYASNRGHNSLAVFSIDPATGKLTSMGHVDTQGKTPRNFAINPTGNFLLIANQDSGSVVTFRVDPVTGQLAAAGQPVNVPSPVCIKFFAP